LNFKKVKDKMDPKYLKTVNSRMGENATFEIHQALQRGECIGLMGDRPIGDRFELIPFLGKLAPFDVTAYRLAAALRVPLLVTFGFKSEEGYDFYARAPRDYQFAPGRSREEQLYEWALDYVREVEHFVKKYPDQWFNFYPFWSALPAAPNGQLAAQANNSLLQELSERPVRAPERGFVPRQNDERRPPPSP
jgi:predicted LPLAT superfamily acyltransferase